MIYVHVRMAGLAGDYAPAGAEVTQSALRQDLSGTPLARSPSYRQAWEVLDGLARRLRDRTRGRLGEGSAQLSLDGGAERKALAARMIQAGRARPRWSCRASRTSGSQP